MIMFAAFDWKTSRLVGEWSFARTMRGRNRDGKTKGTAHSYMWIGGLAGHPHTSHFFVIREKLFQTIEIEMLSTAFKPIEIMRNGP